MNDHLHVGQVRLRVSGVFGTAYTPPATTATTMPAPGRRCFTDHSMRAGRACISFSSPGSWTGATGTGSTMAQAFGWLRLPAGDAAMPAVHAPPFRRSRGCGVEWLGVCGTALPGVAMPTAGVARRRSGSSRPRRQPVHRPQVRHRRHCDPVIQRDSGTRRRLNATTRAVDAPPRLAPYRARPPKRECRRRRTRPRVVPAGTVPPGLGQFHPHRHAVRV